MSILEAIEMLEGRIGARIEIDYQGEPRLGDHICYYTDLTRVRLAYPDWKIQKSVTLIVDEIVGAIRAAAAAHQ